MKSGTSLRINILSAGVSYSESARRKQLPVTFRTRVCPQSCTQRVRFRKDLIESTPRFFLGAARATLKTGVSHATRVILSESARRKQPSIAFQTRVCPQSFTQRVRFCQDLIESTPRVFFGAEAWRRYGGGGSGSVSGGGGSAKRCGGAQRDGGSANAAARMLRRR